MKIFAFINIFYNFVSAFFYSRLFEICKAINCSHSYLISLDGTGEMIGNAFKCIIPLAFHYFKRYRIIIIILNMILSSLGVLISIILGYLSFKYGPLMLQIAWLINRISNGLLSSSRELIIALESEDCKNFIIFKIAKTSGNLIVFFNSIIISFFCLGISWKIFSNISLPPITKINIWILPMLFALIMVLLSILLSVLRIDKWKKQNKSIILFEENKLKNSLLTYLPMLIITELCHIPDQIVYIQNNNMLSTDIISLIKTSGQIIGAFLAYKAIFTNKNIVKKNITLLPIIIYIFSFITMLSNLLIFKILFTFLWGINLTISSSIFMYAIFSISNIKHSIGIKVFTLQTGISFCYFFASEIFKLTSIYFSFENIKKIFLLYSIIGLIINFIYLKFINSRKNINKVD